MAETFSMRREFPVIVEHIQDGISTEPSQGLVQRRKTHKTYNPANSKELLRRFRFSWQDGTEAEVHFLDDLWDKTWGGTLKMDYAPIDGSGTTSVTFAEDGGLRTVRNGLNSYAISVVLEEVPF